MKRQRRWQAFFEGAEITRYHRYKIEYKKFHEIACPRYTFADGNYVVVIPWFLILGRPYPIQVYLYACSLYSANPGMGQRGAAEATRIKFGLETFSHSTICRSFKAFEQARKLALDKRFGEEIQVCGAAAPKLVGAAKKIHADRDEQSQSQKHFPSVADTATRRKEMAKFFPEFANDIKSKDIESISILFIEEFHMKTKRLII